MSKEFITNNFKETQKLGELLALELQGGEVLCMEGDLGAGKTTFTQGLLKGLKVKGPYTSPTFLIMKEYRITQNVERKTWNAKRKLKSDAIHDPRSTIHGIYHIDAYRIDEKDLLNLGWEEIVADDKNIVIVEWSERVKKILPKDALKIKFEWLDKNQRKICFK
ncbi:MAG: tRNA (adenosine(37)-N6)-threonylcarbamoyltransferase complex ATPase subunit type 1 TsaE [Candidatus Moranbacteria bacterium]|nr:tRNA (adenosine(37)-N6)-threonylcarbamoyltransferase complex ATPase subunit type 1 TsaE [Candidatus Moranbacteria bacterium]